uniref:SUZ RNA-binding domain-containing n=1 Tax=Eptatretus burgeri TaxID=7764 RepID=A0A8C4R4F9_EPTBU
MANGQEIVCDDWEEAADTGELERRLDAKLKLQENTKGRADPPQFPVLLHEEENQRTAYVPQIRILKRPVSNGAAGLRPTPPPPTPTKSLAQREAEYAAARQRILGSARPEDDEVPSNEDRPSCPIVSEDKKLTTSVVRCPRGPDGTAGFQLRQLRD